MSYVAHKSRVFWDVDTPPDLVPRRSEGRLKTYASATDARAWCGDGNDRREYILDLVKADHEKPGFGKYVPVQVLVATLLASKTADMEKLKQQVDELQILLDIYSQLDLTEDQKRQLNMLKRQMGIAGDELEKLDTRSTCSAVSRHTKCSARGKGKGKKARTDDGASTSAAQDTDAVEMISTVGSVRIAAPQQTPKDPYDSMSVEELKTTLRKKDEELAAKQAECDQQRNIAKSAVEQLENLNNIMQERDSLKKELQDSMHALETLKKRTEDPCVAEITAMEDEIERLKTKGQMTPEEEAEVIRKEVEVLRKYCAKLSNIHLENKKLKTQVERLEELSGIPKNFNDDADVPSDPKELANSFKELRRKFAKLEEIMDERDKYRTRVHQLETELLKYGGLPEEVEIFKMRSKVLDEVLEDRDNLLQRLNQLTGIEQELIALKRKADRVTELECLLNSAKAETVDIRRNSALEIENLRSEKEVSTMELGNAKAQCDILKTKAANLDISEEELCILKCKAQQVEILRLERERLKTRVTELLPIEMQYMELLEKTRDMEALRGERAMYKRKYEELLGLECQCTALREQVEEYKQLDKERQALLSRIHDCECCIADQEEEIKRLISHIDRTTVGSDQHQDKIQKALFDMKEEIEEKNYLIASSEEQLAGVQNELRHTITGVSCETACLRARIEDLESDVNDLTLKVEEKDIIIETLSDELRDVLLSKEDLQKELDDTIASKENLRKVLEETEANARGPKGDEHSRAALEQSTCPAAQTDEEVGVPFDEWDCRQAQGDDVGELQALVKKLKGQLAEANATIASLRQELGYAENLSLENEALRLHSNEVQGVARDQIEELAQHLRKSKERIVELESLNTELEESVIGKISVENEALRRHSTDVQNVAKQQIEELAAHLKKSKERIAELEAENNKINILLKQFQNDAKSGGVDVGALRMQILNLENENKQLKAQAPIGAVASQGPAPTGGAASQAPAATGGAASQAPAPTAAVAPQAQAPIASVPSKAQAPPASVPAPAQAPSGGAASPSPAPAASAAGPSLQGEVDKLQKEKHALETENANLKQKIDDLVKSSSDASFINKLTKEKEALAAQVEQQKKEIAELSSKSGGAGTSEKDRKEKEDLQNTIKNLQDQIKGMQKGGPMPDISQSSTVNETIAKLTKQLEAEQEKTAAAEENLKKILLEGDNSSLLQERDSLKEKVKELEEKLETLEQENKALTDLTTGDETSLLNEILSLKNKIKALESENATLRTVSISRTGGASTEASSIVGLVDAGPLQLEARSASLGIRSVSKDAPSDYSEKLKSLSSVNEEKLKQSSESIRLLEDSMHLSEEDQIIFNKIKQTYEDLIKDLRNDLEAQRKDCGDTIQLLKSQYSNGIAQLEGSHAEILKDISDEFEKEVEDLRSELRKSQEIISGLESARSSLEHDRVASLTIKTIESVDIKAKSESVTGESKEEGAEAGSEKRKSGSVEGESKEEAAEAGSEKAKSESIAGESKEEATEAGSEKPKSESVAGESKKEASEAVSGKPKSVSVASETKEEIAGVGFKKGSLDSKYKVKMEQRGVCTCGRALKDILNKILKDGFRNLTFDELQYLHTKTCEATTVLIQKNPELAPSFAKSMTSENAGLDSSASGGKLSFMKRISGIEKELISKQKTAQQKMEVLRMAIKMERERLEEFKKALEMEKQRNNELMVRLGAQSRAVANMQVERDMMRKQNSFHEEKLCQIMCQYQEETARVKSLEDNLQDAVEKQKRDSKALETMRLKLEKSLNNEMVLKMQLDQRTQNENPFNDQQVVEARKKTCTHTSTFYTELAIDDIGKKKNFVQHYKLKHRDYPSENDRSSPEIEYCTKCSDLDD